MRSFRTTEDTETWRTGLRAVDDSSPAVRLRQLGDVDLGRVRRLRSVVRWSADPEAFELLRGIKKARWVVAEASSGSLVGMVGAVPLGEIGVLCHLAVRHDHRKRGLGATLARWAVCYLRSRGARLIRLDSTGQAEGLYYSLGFERTSRRTVYRREGPFHGRGQKGDSTSDYRALSLAAGDLPELYGVDYWSYGADRSGLIFAILRRHPGLGLVARDACGCGHIKGYLIQSSTGRVTRIGPFLAADPAAARCLLARALGMRPNAPVEISLPEGGPARELLTEEFGFRGRADRLRMELGEAPGGPREGLAQYGTTPYLAT